MTNYIRSWSFILNERHCVTAGRSESDQSWLSPSLDHWKVGRETQLTEREQILWFHPCSHTFMTQHSIAKKYRAWQWSVNRFSLFGANDNDKNQMDNKTYLRLDHWIMQFESFHWLSHYGLWASIPRSTNMVNVRVIFLGAFSFLVLSSFQYSRTSCKRPPLLSDQFSKILKVSL